MLRILVGLVLVAWVSSQVTDEEGEKPYQCVAWGDPHVTRFPSGPLDQPAEVWCKESGWQTLVKNDYLNGQIHVTDSPFYMDSFSFTFYGNNKKRPCTVTEKDFNTQSKTCSNGVTVTKETDMLVIEDKEHDIKVIIRKALYQPPFYGFWVYQSSPLIGETTGLCKTSCDAVTGQTINERRRRAATPDRSAIKENADKICELYISKLVPNFKITTLNKMDYRVKNAYTSCLSDLKLTGDLAFAKASIEMLAITLSTKDLKSNSDFNNIKKEIIALIGKTNSLINNAELPIGNKPSVPSGDFRFIFDESKAATLNCRNTWSGVIKITSASYQSRSGSCATDVTERLTELCNKKRFCTVNVTNRDLQTSECKGDDKQLKLNYECK